MQKHYFSLAALLVIVVELVGCTATNYTLAPPNTVQGQECVTQCRQSKQICMDNCQPGPDAAAHQECLKRAKQTAADKYEEYVSATTAEGNTVTQTIDSFADPRACTPAVCGNCEQEYRACYQICGGRLVPG